MYKKEIQHLKKDPILKEVIKTSKKEIKPLLSLDIYYFLLDSIVSQQLSVKVADVIFNRVLDLFKDRYPKAEYLLNTDNEILRKAGLSYRKVDYLKNVAHFSLENSLDFDYLQKMSDDEIINYLTQIKGVGKWTVQMILMFPMDRPNVFPVNDLGIQSKMMQLYNLSLAKNKSKTIAKKELLVKLENIAHQWQPYRTLASKYIWNYKNPK